MAWGTDSAVPGAQTARVTASAALHRIERSIHLSRRTLLRALAATAGAVLVAGALVALHDAAAADVDATATVAELDAALGVTPAGSRELDQAPESVVRTALAREANDATALQAAIADGVPAASEQRLGVTFTMASKAAAERLAAYLDERTAFTVAVAAPYTGQPRWSVGGITPRAALTVPVLHQLTERMIEAGWGAGGGDFQGWRVVSR